MVQKKSPSYKISIQLVLVIALPFLAGLPFHNWFIRTLPCAVYR